MLQSVLHIIGWGAGLVAAAGTAYALLAAYLAGRFMRPAPARPHDAVPVTLLKPLHGAEPGLAANLETFFLQEYPGPVQIVFGVQDSADPAPATVAALKARYPAHDIALVVDSTRHGSNGKVSNLVNMLGAARHDVLVLSDSDIAVGPAWLAQVVEALTRPGIGVVTCFYTGAPAPGVNRLWASLAAMGTSYDFLPNTVTGTMLGLARPCFGSTIALRRCVLERVGGFAAFADLLADDYEIGRAVRGLGLGLAIPALAVRHGAAESGPGALLRHELRWMRTIRTVNPGGHLGSFVTHGFAFALIAAILLDFSPPALGLAGISLAARLFLKYRMDAIFGANSGSGWLLPVRDVMTFGVFVVSLFGGTVHWRGSRFAVDPAGAMTRS